MKKFIMKLRKFEFEARIFISFSIVLLICLLSFLVYTSVPNNIIIIGSWFGMESRLALLIGYLAVAMLIVIASLFRMWAGSVLTSQRMMAFHVQKDKLTTSGPYCLVRNPIYLADLIAFCGFALCLKPIGLALPILLYLHYTQLVIYEEKSLQQKFGKRFQSYKKAAPRFIPDLRSVRQFFPIIKGFNINLDGFRHNALYLLFIPGFIVAAFSSSLVCAIIIGLPAVVDWAIVHTRKGFLPQFPNAQMKSNKQQKEKFSQTKAFGDILYAQCWEDPEIDRQAFNIDPGDVVFSITSGGCNVLAFLIDNPRKIIALDLNPCQNYLLRLKIAAFKILNYNTLLEFLGVTPSTWRLGLYSDLRPHLKQESRDYWDKQPTKIKAGIIHSGRYEGYMRLLRKWFNRLMGKSLAKKLFAINSQKERVMLYKKKWNNMRWKFFTRLLLSRAVMTLLFDKAFFAQLENTFSFGKHFRNIIKRAVTELPLRENNFFAYILLGQFYSLQHLPVYLREENFDVIRSRLDRIELVCGKCEDYFTTLPPDCISKFNFTNIFEWMSPEDFEKLLRETVRVAKDGSIITYRNLLVPRSRPESLAQWIEPQKELSEKLHKRDLSFIYKAYVVEQINKE
ncbi:DUF3419 family protein [Candidatus Pacearchaeota archaeon]|nr:DUF3419 family protein [Candidatus Pacearchaeota archaeon]